MLKGKGRDYVIINVGGTCHRITHRTPTGYRRIATRGEDLEFVLRYLIDSKLDFKLFTNAPNAPMFTCFKRGTYLAKCL